MAIGYSDLSNEVSATTELTPPEWVDIDTTVDDEIILDFQRTDSTNSGDITIYRSQSDGTLGSSIATLNYDATTYTDTTANVDEVNYYTLRRDTGDVTADSIQANTLLPPPGITPNTTKWDAHLMWSDAATTEVGYRVYQQPQGGNEELVADLPQDSTEYQTDRLTILDSDPDTWTYRVEAYRPGLSEGEETTASEAVTFTLPGITFTGDWTVIRPNASDDAGTPYVESETYDVDPVVDTANPFGDFAVAKIDDIGGGKFELYPRGERVEFWRNDQRPARLTGYVVERRETEQSGADALEVEAYSFDQFLRRNTVTNDQSGSTITEALEDIVTTDTPVSWNAENIEVGDEQDLTRSYQGVKVENVLRDLAFKSNNEEFGVNDQLEFFFRPREAEHIERGIDNTQWFNYDIPELGKQAINEVEVWFNDGDESVIVDDGTDKLDLQDSLDLTDPGTQRAERQRPTITNIADAEDVGRKYLQFRNATLSGTVTTYGLYDAEPGDTIDITIEPRGINEEFVIAAVEYRWGMDQTILTIIEKRGEQDGILTELNDSVQRVEMNGADRDAPKNRITTTQANAIVSVSVDADGNTPSDLRFVNDGRRSVRDGWTGKPNPTISNIVAGDDGSNLSRSNTALVSQTASANATENLPDAKTVEYSASITQSGVEEIGLTTADGTLITRAIFDSPVDLAGAVTVSLSVSNDASVSRGVLTNDGQTAVRNVLADNTPAIPTDYAYGSDGTAVDESQTALGNEVVSENLESVLIQSANTTSEWSGLAGDIPAQLPLNADDDSLGPTITCFTTEGEAYTTGDTGSVNDPQDPSEFSNGNYASLSVSGHSVTYEFTLEHEIPANQFEIPIRLAGSDTSGGTAATNYIVRGPDGELASGSLIADGANIPSPAWLTEIRTSEFPNALPPGTYELELDCVTTATALNDQTTFIDVVAPRDVRYSVNLDDTVDGNGALAGPERYPASVEYQIQSAGTRRPVTEANFTSAWTDTTGNQYVELANDGSTFTRFSNASSGSVSFESAEAGVDVRFGFGRYSSGNGQTPTDGDAAQRVQSWELYANPSAVVSDDIDATNTRAVIPPNTITGETIREAGLKNGNVLLSRHELAEFEVLADQRLASSETTKFIGDN